MTRSVICDTCSDIALLEDSGNIFCPSCESGATSLELILERELEMEESDSSPTSD